MYHDAIEHIPGHDNDVQWVELQFQYRIARDRLEMGILMQLHLCQERYQEGWVARFINMLTEVLAGVGVDEYGEEI